MTRKTVKSIEDDIREQVRINRAAAALLETGIREIQNGAKEVRAKVKAFQGKIKEQVEINHAAVLAIGAGTREIEAGIRKVHSDIRAQVRETANFITAFYGYGKGE